MRASPSAPNVAPGRLKPGCGLGIRCAPPLEPVYSVSAVCEVGLASLEVESAWPAKGRLLVASFVRKAMGGLCIQAACLRGDSDFGGPFVRSTC